ncbi:MAG: AAA family ATPase, partial [Bacteroidales bacterium]|nr:AAA family ATPase [Bacteroidales bacterium]
VIAGENDTGKSTVGKALYSFLKSISKDDKVSNLNLNSNFKNIFDNQIANNGNIKLKNNSKVFEIKIIDNRCEVVNGETLFSIVQKLNSKITMVETPLVWNFSNFFRDIALIESQMDIKVDYPYLMKDLNFKLFIKSASNGIDIKDNITSLINGEFKQDEKGDFYFERDGKRIELINTATGIKYFGIFQVLSQNNYLNENAVLVLDEPEVHLHPKWQLEMAKIIVELVKNGVKVLVNSHSPYMIEALQRYAELEKVNADFYLAEDGYIKKENDSNSETLAKIFEKLSEPFDVFEEMDSQKMEKFING